MLSKVVVELETKPLCFTIVADDPHSLIESSATCHDFQLVGKGTGFHVMHSMQMKLDAMCFGRNGHKG